MPINSRPNTSDPCGGAQLGTTGTSVDGVKTWIVSSSSAQPFYFSEDRSSLIMASPGTTFAPESEFNVFLKDGRLTAITGARGLTVQTSQGLVSIPPQSTVSVEQNGKNVVRIDNMVGGQAGIKTSKQLNVSTTVDQGQELVLADDSLNDEELIPVDGVQREPVAGGKVMAAGLNVMKSNIDVGQMARREDWLFLMLPCIDHPIRRRLTDLQEKMNASVLLKSQETSSKPPLIGYVTKDRSAKAGRKAMKNSQSDLVSAVTQLPILGAPMELAMAQPGLVCRHISHKTAEIRYSSSTNMIVAADGAIELKGGEALIYATHPTSIQCRGHVVAIKPGTVAWLTRDEQTTRVCSLAAQSPDSIEVVVRNKSIPVSYGEELVLGDVNLGQWLTDDMVDRRRVRMADMQDNLCVAKSEASPFSVFNASDLLCEVYESKDRKDKVITEKIVKMASCLTVVTGKNGPYSRLK